MGEQVEEMNYEQRQLLTRKKGGLVTMSFIIANEAFEKVASYGLVPNMILYLMSDYKIGVAKGTNILFVWTAASNFLLFWVHFFQIHIWVGFSLLAWVPAFHFWFHSLS